MLELRLARDRGHADHGWLQSHHTFSFADYHDPRYMGFRNLRVLNEDRVAPGRGFDTHGHRDMEIVSYVLSGELAHRDSMGNGSVIRPGELQRMSAGTGVTHSEHNPSRTAPLHFLQLWLLPERRGVPPSYEQKAFAAAERDGALRLLASRDGAEGSLTLHCDARLYAGQFSAGQAAQRALAPGRYVWVHVARGELLVQGRRLGAGDAAALADEAQLSLEGLAGAEAAEVLVFDLP